VACQWSLSVAGVVRDRQNLSPNRTWQLHLRRDHVQLCIFNMGDSPADAWCIQQPGFLRAQDARETATHCWQAATALLECVVDVNNRQSIEQFQALWIDAIASSVYRSPDCLLMSQPGNVPCNSGQVLVGAFACHRTLPPQCFPLCRRDRHSLPGGPQLKYACLVVSKASPDHLQLSKGVHPLVWS
jgi:hypothetical protein